MTTITDVLKTHGLDVALRVVALHANARQIIVNEIKSITEYDRRDDVCSLNDAIALYNIATLDNHREFAFLTVVHRYTALCLKIGYTQQEIDADLSDFIIWNNL